MGMGSDDPDVDDKMGEHGYSDEETREIMDFMDDSLPQEERVSALQEAIRLCVEKHVSPDALTGASAGGERPKGDTGLALIFGGGEPKKKK